MDRWLATNRPGYYDRLQTDVGRPAFDAFEAEFQVKLPDAFRLLYQSAGPTAQF